MTLIQFDDTSGRRIGDAVRFVEEQANKRKPLAYSPLLESARRRNVLRDAELTANVISDAGQLFNGSGPLSDNAKLVDVEPEESIGVVNPMGSTLLSGTRVIVALNSQGAWGIVAVNLATIYGFDAAETQVLARGLASTPMPGENSGVENTSGVLMWLNTTNCVDGTPP